MQSRIGQGLAQGRSRGLPAVGRIILAYNRDMSIIAFIILGAIAGFIARAIVPGRISSGLIPALICGVVGAVVGGWLSSRLLDIDLGGFWNLRSWVIAIAGSVLVLVVWGMIKGRSNNKQ